MNEFNFVPLWTKWLLNPNDVWDKTISIPPKAFQEFQRESLPIKEEEIEHHMADFSDILLKRNLLRRRLGIGITIVFGLVSVIMASLAVYSFMNGNIVDFIGTLGITLALLPVLLYVFGVIDKHA